MTPAEKAFVNYLCELDIGVSDEHALIKVSNSELPPTELAVLFHENAENWSQAYLPRIAEPSPQLS